MDALSLLTADHNRVRGLFARFQSAEEEKDTETMMELAAKIIVELEVHTTIEEEIFYPAYHQAARKKEDKKLFFEAVQEHHVVDLVMPEMNDGSSPEELKARAKVLKDLVEHHADEEEKEMFPRARKVMDREELRSLGEMLLRRKEDLMA